MRVHHARAEGRSRARDEMDKVLSDMAVMSRQTESMWPPSELKLLGSTCMVRAVPCSSREKKLFGHASAAVLSAARESRCPYKLDLCFGGPDMSFGSAASCSARLINVAQFLLKRSRSPTATPGASLYRTWAATPGGMTCTAKTVAFLAARLFGLDMLREVVDAVDDFHDAVRPPGADELVLATEERVERWSTRYHAIAQAAARRDRLGHGGIAAPPVLRSEGGLWARIECPRELTAEHKGVSIEDLMAANASERLGVKLGGPVDAEGEVASEWVSGEDSEDEDSQRRARLRRNLRPLATKKASNDPDWSDNDDGQCSASDMDSFIVDDEESENEDELQSAQALVVGSEDEGEPDVGYSQMAHYRAGLSENRRTKRNWQEQHVTDDQDESEEGRGSHVRGVRRSCVVDEPDQSPARPYQRRCRPELEDRESAQGQQGALCRQRGSKQRGSGSGSAPHLLRARFSRVVGAAPRVRPVRA